MNRRFLSCLGCIALACLPAPALEWWTAPGAREHFPNAERPADAPQHVALLAPANGVASGQVVLKSGKPLAAPLLRHGDLTNGDASIAASQLRLRYLVPADVAGREAPSTGPLDVISDDFVPSEHPLAILYVTVDVPADAVPGNYEGDLHIETPEATLRVPVRLTVADFVMPARGELDLWISLAQSPTQLAYAYGVEPYGEAHWRAIEASVRLLGDMGHHVLFVPVLWHANVGTGPQMVVFTREGDTLKPDFSRLERYFQLVARECGPQRLLVLGVWGRWQVPPAEGAWDRETQGPHISDSLFLTERRADGSLAPLEWSADYAAHETLWKEVYEGVATRAEKILAVGRDRLVLGFGDDVHPTDGEDAVWRRIAPDSPGWEAWTHNYGGKGPRPAFFQIVDTDPPKSVDDLFAWPARSGPVLKNGVAVDPIYISACRDIQNHRSPPALYYSIPDLATTPQKTGHNIGFSRIGLDYWVKEFIGPEGQTVKTDGFGRDGVDNRSFPGRVMRNYRGMLTAQGPVGAMPLIHFDALREGVQAAQARLLIARAVAAGKLGDSVARPVLQAQFEGGARHGLLKSAQRQAIAAVDASTLHAGWLPLFELAGQAQRVLGERESALASAAAERGRRAGR